MKAIPSTIKVEVATRHFKSALAYMSNSNCPLAQALKEKFPNSDPNVGSTMLNLTFNENGARHEYKIVSGWLSSEVCEDLAQETCNNFINTALQGHETPSFVVLLEKIGKNIY